MADSDSTNGFNDREYFTYPAVVGLMADTLKESNPGVFRRCANAIDMMPSSTLRGLGYLGCLLSRDDDATDVQWQSAAGAIAEMTALMAVLIEMQNDAGILEHCENLRHAKADEVTA